jgi:hypothetical protein
MVAKRKEDKLTDEQLKTVCEIYREVGTPLDKLAFNPDFDRLHLAVESRIARRITKPELWQELQNARKAKKLPPLMKKQETRCSQPSN